MPLDNTTVFDLKQARKLLERGYDDALESKSVAVQGRLSDAIDSVDAALATVFAYAPSGTLPDGKDLTDGR